MEETTSPSQQNQLGAEARSRFVVGSFEKTNLESRSVAAAVSLDAILTLGRVESRDGVGKPQVARFRR